MQRRDFQAWAALGALGLATGRAQAQEWPAKPVRMVLSQPPGSGADSIARLVGEHMAKGWGQSLVIDNKPGGQNVIGAQAAARSPADGYALYFGTAAALVSNAYLFKSLPYDPQRDFVPVGLIAKVPFLVVVPAASPFKTMADLVAKAKAQPGKLSFANEGPKTFGGIQTRLLSAKLGLELNQVAYASVSGAVTDAVGGQTEALLCDMPSALPMVQAGRLRALAVTTARKVPALEGAAPIAELVPGFDFAGWLGIVAPTGTPDAILQRLSRSLDAALRDKDVAGRIQAIGPTPEAGTSAESFRAFLQAEHARWASLSKDIGLLPE